MRCATQSNHHGYSQPALALTHPHPCEYSHRAQTSEVPLLPTLYPPDPTACPSLRSNLHAVNTVALLIEFGTDRMLIPVQQLLLYLAWGVAYILFEWAIHPFTSGRASAHPTGWADKAGWAYPFLRLDALAPLWYGGVLASSALLYVGALGASALKSHWLARRVDPSAEARTACDQDSSRWWRLARVAEGV